MSITICGKLSADVVVDCSNPLQAGTEDSLILINRSDIVSTTRNGTDNEIVENITLASGTTGYLYQGQNNSIAPKCSMVKLKHFRRWSHELQFLVYGVDSLTKQQMQKLKDSDLVAIVFNKFKGAGGDCAFELYGLDAGLKTEKIDRDVMSADTQGAYDVSLMSDKDTGLEPFPVKTIFITNYATTLAMIEGLYS